MQPSYPQRHPGGRIVNGNFKSQHLAFILSHIFKLESIVRLFEASYLYCRTPLLFYLAYILSRFSRRNFVPMGLLSAWTYGAPYTYVCHCVLCVCLQIYPCHVYVHPCVCVYMHAGHV